MLKNLLFHLEPSEVCFVGIMFVAGMALVNGPGTGPGMALANGPGTGPGSCKWKWAQGPDPGPGPWARTRAPFFLITLLVGSDCPCWGLVS